MKTANEILAFWFSPDVRPQWFKSSDAFDALVRRTAETTAIRLAADLSTSDTSHVWERESLDAHLALIIALDQFPRNMYRATPAAFAWDSLALTVARRLVASKRDFELPQDQRAFVYMPYMHSEVLADQETGVSLCEARLDGESTLRFAKIHRDIIAQFGRFPHRNAFLKRASTEEEQTFLDEGGFRA